MSVTEMKQYCIVWVEEASPLRGGIWSELWMIAMERTEESALQIAETANEKALSRNKFGVLNWNKAIWARGMWSHLYFKSSLLLGP